MLYGEEEKSKHVKDETKESTEVNRSSQESTRQYTKSMRS